MKNHSGIVLMLHYMSEYVKRLFSLPSSVTSSRAATLHPEWRRWHAHTNDLHWDGHPTTRRRRAGMEGVCQVHEHIYSTHICSNSDTRYEIKHYFPPALLISQIYFDIYERDAMFSVKLQQCRTNCQSKVCLKPVRSQI